MTIVDTTVWIDYLRGTVNPETSWLSRKQSHELLGLTDMILCEVLQGIADPAAFAAVRQGLTRFDVFETGGVDLAVASATNYRFLRQRGYTVRKTIDCWIASFCLLAGHTLLHRDRDFDIFESHLGLQVIHP
jgi:hypothetical protein